MKFFVENQLYILSDDADRFVDQFSKGKKKLKKNFEKRFVRFRKKKKKKIFHASKEGTNP